LPVCQREGFHHHQDAEPLTHLHKLGRGWVVRGPQRVDAHALHLLHLELERVVVHGRPERAIGGVQVDAHDLHVLAVEAEPGIRVKCGVAEANPVVVMSTTESSLTMSVRTW